MNNKIYNTIIYFNGPINYSTARALKRRVGRHEITNKCTLIFITEGGDDDCALKLADWLRNRFKRVRIVLPGPCKGSGIFIAVAGHESAFDVYGNMTALQADTDDETFTDNSVKLQSGSPTREADWVMEMMDIDLDLAEIFFPVETTNAEDSYAMALLGNPPVKSTDGKHIIRVVTQDAASDEGFDLIDLTDYSRYEPQPHDGPRCIEIIHVGGRI